MAVYRNLWYCPGSLINISQSILNPLPILNTNVWALNEKRKRSFDILKSGDLCIFKYPKRSGYYIVMQVFNKFIANDAWWPFKSPSGALWKYGFSLSLAYYVFNNEPDPFKGYMTQSLVTNPNIRTMFVAPDTDHDGFITVAEIKNACMVDINKDGTITEDERTQCARVWINEKLPLQDLNNDQKITLQELFTYNNNY